MDKFEEEVLRSVISDPFRGDWRPFLETMVWKLGASTETTADIIAFMCHGLEYGARRLGCSIRAEQWRKSMGKTDFGPIDVDRILQYYLEPTLNEVRALLWQDKLGYRLKWFQTGREMAGGEWWDRSEWKFFECEDYRYRGKLELEYLETADGWIAQSDIFPQVITPSSRTKETAAERFHHSLEAFLFHFPQFKALY